MRELLGSVVRPSAQAQCGLQDVGRSLLYRPTRAGESGHGQGRAGRGEAGAGSGGGMLTEERGREVTGKGPEGGGEGVRAARRCTA